MKNKYFSLSLVLALLLAFTPFSETYAQKKKKSKSKSKTESAEKKENDYEKTLKSCEKMEGLLEMYRDTTDGSLYIALQPDQLGEEFIYFSMIADGVLDAGFFRGGYRGSRVISLEQSYDRVQVIGKNTRYYFDENNALSKAKDANINNPVLASLKIKATNDSTGQLLISGDEIFKSEDFQMIKRPTRKGSEPGMLGKLSTDKTTVDEIRNYPENSDVIVSYVYENSNPQSYGSEAVTDPRNITVKYQHSIIAMPENNFKPRRDDARIGYFMTSVNDMTSLSSTPYRDMIHRWHLEKKDPEAALSDPVEPIVFWIENTTPEEFRPIIKSAGERWNQAFEKAGFTNAVVIKEQPDTATWDAGDIRYNVLRWTSSPRAPFGGYGPSFVNPRTGQILGADVMLEFSSIARRLMRMDAFETAGFSFDEDHAHDMLEDDIHYCSAGHVMNHNMMFGMTAMRVNDLDEAAREKFVQETLHRLILHEIGHTLGLTHNMRGSTLLSFDEVNDPAVVAEKGLCNSVMEYPAINYAKSPELATKYFDDKPGPYDLWVIEYGYSVAEEDPEAEEERLERILSRSTQPELVYGNDGDDMRSPGKGIDPDINIYDLTSEPVKYGVARIELVNELFPKVLEKYSKEGQSYEDLRMAYFILTGEQATQLGVFTRQIGGIHINRALEGQDGNDTAPFTPVPASEQKAAMEAIARYGFAPDAFSAAQNVYDHLQPQRRGFNQPRNGEDPKIHARILSIQKSALNHLLNANVLERITDTQLYGNEYPLDEYMTDLTNSIFQADIGGNISPMRQNLQLEYTKRLAGIIQSKSYDDVSKSMALYELNRIDRMAQSGGGNTLSKAHRAHLRQLIKNTLEA
jgi:hypothetical protein